MIKTVLKFTLCIFVYTIVFILANLILPFSQILKDLGDSENPLTLLFMLLYNAWICFTIYFIMKNTNLRGKKLFLNLVFIMFFVQSFMMHMETLFFGNPLLNITKLDSILIMLGGLFPLLATVPLSIMFFQNKDIVMEKIETKINLKYIFIKLGIIGIAYLCSYVLFGFLVTWLFEAYKTHYGEAILNTPNVYLNAFIQILRGILYGVFIVPLMKIIKTKREFILGVCMVYVCTGIQLTIPNKLISDQLRIAYIIEVTGAMLLFGIIAGNILWWNKKQKTST
jgi:hypothetical protein